MSPFPCLVRAVSPSGETHYSLGHPLLDRYLEFVAGRARRNTIRAVAFDLKTFFTVIDKDPIASPWRQFRYLDASPTLPVRLGPEPK